MTEPTMFKQDVQDALTEILMIDRDALRKDMQVLLAIRAHHLQAAIDRYLSNELIHIPQFIQKHIVNYSLSGYEVALTKKMLVKMLKQHLGMTKPESKFVLDLFTGALWDTLDGAYIPHTTKADAPIH